MKNRPAVRRGLLAAAVALMFAAQPGASPTAAQGNPPPGGGQAAPGPPKQPVQEPSPAATADRPVLRTTTRLVQVSVVAHDSHGSPIADLTQEDFRLYDNGQEQKIAFFSKDSSEVVPETAPTLPPDTWSNVASRNGGTPVNLTVILFDQVNTASADQANARNQIIRFLKQMRPQDRIALYALGQNLRILHDFTSDAASLLRALERAQARNGRLVADNDPGTGPLGDTTGDADLDAFLAAADTAFVQYQIKNRVLITTDALEAIAAHVGSLPGRKNLLWVSSGFPMLIGYDMDSTMVQQTGLDSVTFVEEVDRAERALNDANVAVYPVDAHRLGVNLTAITTPYVAPSNSRVPRVAAPTVTPNRSGVETMENVAGRTGGVAYHDTNDLTAALRSAMDDSRLVYTLAYMPTHNEWDNKFRKIRVETRRQGAHLRFRNGYFAIPDAHLDPKQREEVLAEAQWSVFEATQISLKLTAVRMTLEDKAWIRFALLADSAGLRFTDNAGTHDTDMILTMGQKGPDGLLVKEETKTLTFRLKDDRYQEVMAKGMRLTATMPLDPSAVRFRVVLLDAADGHMGSLEIPVVKMRTVAAPAGSAAPGAPASPAAPGAPAVPAAQKPGAG